MEFLEKVVQNERTGANISGIQIDVNTQHLLDKPFLKGFEELEKLAKEMDAIKIKNKRTEFELNLEQMDLDFAEKWNDPNIYRDKEKYEAMLEDRKALQSEKAKLLSSNMYYNREEKINLKKELENKNKEIILGYQKNRNIEYLRETINSTNANIDQLIAIGQKNISPTDYDSISKYVKRISENLSYLKTPLGLSEKELENMIGTRAKTLINGIYQEHLNKIISDPNMSTDKQEIELKKLAYSMDNKEYKEKLATDLANEFAKEDVEQTKNFFLTSFDSETKTIINQYRARFNEIKRARAKEEKAEQAFYRKQLKSSIKEKDRQVEKAMNNKDPYAFLKYKYGIDVSYQELSDRDDLIDKITGRTGISYADKDNNMAFRFVPPEINTLDEFNDYMAENQFTGAERDKRVKSFAASSKIPLAVIDKGMSDPKYKEIYEEGIYANSMRKKSKISISDIKKDGLFKNWGDHNDNIDGLVDYYKSLSYSQVEAEEKAVEFMISKNLPELVNTKNSNEKIEILYDFADNFDISDYKDDLTVIKEIKNSKPQRFVNFKDEKRERNKKTNSKTTSRPNHK